MVRPRRPGQYSSRIAAMLLAVRIAFWLQLLLGLGLSRGFFGARPLGVAGGEGDLHMLVGLIAAVLAIVVFRPGTGASSNGLTTAAAFFPLVPLLFGLAVRFAGMSGVAFIIVHVLLGLVAVGLIEAASGRRRRLLRAPPEDVGASAPS